MRDWGEPTIAVFCAVTGDTLLLDADGAAVLLALQVANTPISADALCALLADPDTPPAQTAARMTEVLDDLARRHLVEYTS